MPKLTRAQIQRKASAAWQRWWRKRPEYPEQNGCLFPTEVWEEGYRRGYEAAVHDMKAQHTAVWVGREALGLPYRPSPRPSFLSPDMG